MDPALLIPVKRFDSAKGRLAPLLSAPERVRLARWLATHVILSAQPLPVFVACDDEGVASWADELGAEVLWTPGLGLNGAIDASRVTIGGKGFDHLVIAHSDLPLARLLPSLPSPDTITLVPDRWNDGTNVLAAPIAAGLPARYGAGSFRAHLGQALASGCAVEVRRDPWLGLDIDTPADLHHPAVVKELPAWVRTILDSRR